MTTLTLRCAAISATVLLSILAAPALAADITLLSPGAMMSSLKQLIPRFETASRQKVTVTYSPALAIAERARTDEAAATVIILGEGSADALEKLGKLAAGSKTVIARVGVGVFVRRGDPKPDISTVEAFTHALMSHRLFRSGTRGLGLQPCQRASCKARRHRIGQVEGQTRHAVPVFGQLCRRWRR